nr:tRNA (guanine(26)-N(2))-dimethyltransferase [Tanacetum cinerariifolium]
MKERYPAFDRISAVLTTICEELLVYLYSRVYTIFVQPSKCILPSAVIFRSAVINAGYSISGTHVNPLGLKSDAPMEPSEDYESVILAKEPVLQSSFARAVASLSKAQAKKVVRILPNPDRHWGPKLRAGRTITSKHTSLLAYNNEEQGEEPEARRKKTQDSTSIS